MEKSKYEDDFAGWCSDQAELLRSQNSENLDYQNLADEVESLIAKDKLALKSFVYESICWLFRYHLVNAEVQDWVQSKYMFAGDMIRGIFEASPSLKEQYIFNQQWLNRIYRQAIVEVELLHTVKVVEYSKWSLSNITDSFTDESINPDFFPKNFKVIFEY